MLILTCVSLYVTSIKSRVKRHLRLYLAYIADREPEDEEAEEEEEIQAVEEVPVG
jgi:hypothetical protein